MSRSVSQALVVAVSLFGSISVNAAQLIDLDQQPVAILKNYISAPATPSNSASSSLRSAVIPKTDEMKEIRRATDNNHTTHVRLQQYHGGYPVWGTDSVVHVPAASKRNMVVNFAALPANTAMSGNMYQGLDADLANNSSPQIFNATQLEKAKSKALEIARSKYGNGAAEVKTQKLMVYVDSENKARWAFLVSVYMDSAGEEQVAANPIYIMDAVTFDVYKSWNDIKTASDQGGGYGGNTKTGKLVYDGLPGNLATLKIQRDFENICHMKNEDVVILHAHQTSGNFKPVTFNCGQPDRKHNNVFWNEAMDSVNGGFSPQNDALYAGSVVQSLYKEWYKLPMLRKNDGSPMVLEMVTHYRKAWENAAWNDVTKKVYLGDGKDIFYPLTSLGVVAHEVSHGFTTQHSDLVYADQSGGLNESFSDMAAMAAEAFATGQSTWQIGPEIRKAPDTALRYMDQPSKDCRKGKTAGSGCSIDSATEYDHLVNYGRNELDLFGDDLQSYIVHRSSGVFNRAFYLLATSSGWDVRKTFEVMIHANSFYWTPSTDFKKGACGVAKAAKDLHYNVTDVAAAFSKVGLDTAKC